MSEKCIKFEIVFKNVLLFCNVAVLCTVLTVYSGSTTVAGGTISLDVNASDIDSSLEKYAISNAMAQSVQLAIWEFMLEELIDYLEPITIVRC